MTAKWSRAASFCRRARPFGIQTSRAAIFLALALGGCGRSNTDKTVAVFDEPGPAYYVHETRLKDGTRCVVSTSGRSDGGTGIVCDWRSSEEPE
jgi:hypothetical protein